MVVITVRKVVYHIQEVIACDRVDVYSSDIFLGRWLIKSPTFLSLEVAIIDVRQLVYAPKPGSNSKLQPQSPKKNDKVTEGQYKYLCPIQYSTPMLHYTPNIHKHLPLRSIKDYTGSSLSKTLADLLQL